MDGPKPRQDRAQLPLHELRRGTCSLEHAVSNSQTDPLVLLSRQFQQLRVHDGKSSPAQVPIHLRPLGAGRSLTTADHTFLPRAAAKMKGNSQPPVPGPVPVPVPGAPASLSETAPAVSTSKNNKNYKGFVAGVFSGIAKLSVGHPFDTIKVRLQTSPPSKFTGPLQCVTQTLRNEGIFGLYKGATPPLVGWMFMDSVMLGSLTVYRRLVHEKLFNPSIPLPSYGHGIAGICAGATVSFIAAPVEHIKARLQIQYAANKAERLYKGPIDALAKIYKFHGVKGVYHGLGATLLFRGFFFCWWGSYDVFSRWMREHTQMSAPAINFWAGGLSAQIFWLTSYPSDVVKQRIMTDPLGGGLNDGVRRFPRWKDAAVAVYKEGGWRGYWRGFLPCFLRAFPANAMALLAFEGVMRALP